MKKYIIKRDDNNWLSVEHTQVLLRDVKRIEFYNIYLQLLVRFYNQGKLNDYGIKPKLIIGIEDYLSECKSRQDKSEAEMIIFKELISKYRVIFRDEIVTKRYELIPLFQQYLATILTDLRNINNNILYIDTDRIYYTGEIDTTILSGLIFYESHYDVMYIHSPKKFIYYHKGEYSTIGYKKSSITGAYSPSDQDIIKNEIKELIRTIKLNEVLDEI